MVQADLDRGVVMKQLMIGKRRLSKGPLIRTRIYNSIIQFCSIKVQDLSQNQLPVL